MQLKSMIKNLASKKRISAQLMMQNFMLERLLERISISDYKSNFILKGGFLIASIVGLDTRATMDMDATIKGLSVNEISLRKIFDDICLIQLNDNINFIFSKIEKIREGDEYEGYRVSITANYYPMAVPLKLDITTGDKITPKEIDYRFKLLFEDRSISILAYNLETMMSEKLETVISRGDQNTRSRDYYDIYILSKLHLKNINLDILKTALTKTSEKRNSIELIYKYKDILEVIKSSDIMEKQWINYQNNFRYAININFKDTCNAIIEIMELLKF